MSKISIVKHPPGSTNGADLTDHVKNGLSVIESLEEHNDLPRFKVQTATEMLARMPKPVDWIVDGLIAKDVKTVIGGMTGANKSYFVMEMAVRISCGVGEFMGHAIKQSMKVLYINLEISDDEVLRRIAKILDSMDIDRGNLDNLLINNFSGNTFDKHWEKIDNTITMEKPDLVIVDNLYSSTNVNLSRNDEIKKLLRQIDDVVKKNNITLILVAHFNKGVGETELSLDRMQGASSFQNWIEFCILLGKSTVNAEYRLMRTVKSRISNVSNHHYLLQWNGDTHLFSKVGVARNPEVHFMPVNKLGKYDAVLSELNKHFSRSDWLNMVDTVNGKDKIKMRTADRWLAECVNTGLVIRQKNGLFNKSDLQILSDED